MTDLLTKLRAATGPDRELDVYAWAEWQGRDLRVDEHNVVLAKSRTAPFDECVVGYVDPGKHSSNFQIADHSIPKLSASIDAALSLRPKLPNGAYLCTILEIYASGEANCCLHPFKGPPIWSRKQATAPLAILTAIFEAREAENG